MKVQVVISGLDGPDQMANLATIEAAIAFLKKAKRPAPPIDPAAIAPFAQKAGVGKDDGE